MPEPHDKIITGIPLSGHGDYGQGIRFQLTYESGPAEFFYCRADLFPKLLTGLNLAGGIAARTRSSGPGGLIDLVTPVKMTSATRTGQFQDGSIVFEFGCDMGFPMQLSMTRNQVARTIELLQAELGRNPPSPKDTTN